MLVVVVVDQDIPWKGIVGAGEDEGNEEERKGVGVEVVRRWYGYRVSPLVG